MTNGSWEAATPEKVFTKDAQIEGSLSWPLSCPKKKKMHAGKYRKYKCIAISKKK